MAEVNANAIAALPVVINDHDRKVCYKLPWLCRIRIKEAVDLFIILVQLLLLPSGVPSSFYRPFPGSRAEPRCPARPRPSWARRLLISEAYWRRLLRSHAAWWGRSPCVAEPCWGDLCAILWHTIGLAAPIAAYGGNVYASLAHVRCDACSSWKNACADPCVS